MNKEIIEFLSQLNLSSGESRLYLNLLELGPVTIKELNLKKSIPRTTAKENIDKLIIKGLIKKVIKNKKKIYIAEDPGKLSVLIANKDLTLQSEVSKNKKLKEDLPNILDSIQGLLPTSELRTGILYHGKDKVWEIYKQVINSSKSYSIADLDKYYAIFPGTADIWNSSYTTNPDREEWDIVLDTPLAREIISVNIKNYHTKFIPKAYSPIGSIFTDYIVFDDKSAIIQLEENALMGIVFDSKYITDTMRTLIKLIWDLLPDQSSAV